MTGHYSSDKFLIFFQKKSNTTISEAPTESPAENATGAEDMCNSILDRLKSTRDEMRADKWSIEKMINVMLLRHLFTMNGTQIKLIVETLNFLGLTVEERATAAKAVVDQIVLIQQKKGHLNLLDFHVTLSDIMLPEFYVWLTKLLENCKSVFGCESDQIRYQAVDLIEIDGTFDSQFSSALCLTAGPVDAPPTPVATSSATDSQGNSRAEVMARVSKANPSFAEKLQQFGN